MININNNISNWDKKIIYAPNSFGKTRSSKILYDHYAKLGEKVEIFSRRRIESLIKSFNQEFFIGKDAIYEYEKAKILSTINKSKPIEELYKFLKIKSAKGLKEKSFYCRYASISNTGTIPNIDQKIWKKFKIFNSIDKLELELLDSELDYSIYSEIKTIFDNFNKGELFSEKRTSQKDNNEVSEQIFGNLQELYMYCKLNNVTKCYFCGKSYKSHKSLIEHIENRLGELKINNNNKDKISILAVKIKNFVEKSKSKIVQEIFSKLEINTISKQLTILKLYQELCECNVSYWHNELLSMEIKVNLNDADKIFTIFELTKKIEILENKLEKRNNAKKNKRIETFINNVIKKINKYIKFDKEVVVKPLKEKVGLEFEIAKKKIDPVEYLSESELKRIALIVLEQEIRYQHIKTVILDDPVDSYDDYNKRVACQYMSEILSKKSLNHWYIFTNDFECVYYLSYSLNKNTIFCLGDLNCVFNTGGQNYEIECKPCEVNIIAKNDLYFLDKFINLKEDKFPFDKDILFCALTLTLRNVKTDFLNKYIKIDFANNTLLNKAQWSTRIRDTIEKCAEHYDHDLSPKLLIKEVAEPFHNLNSSSRKSCPSKLYRNTSWFEIFRETTAKKNFVIKGDYTDVVNYLFMKVLMINYIKYEFEKKIMLKIKNFFSQQEFNDVDDVRTGLYNRISKAISIDKKNGNVLGKFLSKANEIHKNYSSLYNAIDHCTILMVSPYLSISVKDIINFKNEVDGLN